MHLSVIIPTLNEAAVLPACLEAVARSVSVAEIIVVDGGSTDETVVLARRAGARMLSAPRGRGAQLDAGARVASGNVFWFLHADTLAPPDAAEQIARAFTDESVVAGNFHLIFDGPEPGAKFLTALYPRLRWLGLRYGDSGFFVHRSAYEKAGGFRPLPIFEDLDFLRRVRPLGAWTTLPGPLIASSRRFRGRPFAPVFAKWAGLQTLYWLRCDPARLGRIYYPDHARSVASPNTDQARRGMRAKRFSREKWEALGNKIPGDSFTLDDDMTQPPVEPWKRPPLPACNSSAPEQERITPKAKL